MNQLVRRKFTVLAAGVLYLLSGSALYAGSLLVQSTTSTANSGLYDHLLPVFAESSDIQVRVVAVGTGQAIRNASNCDADVLLVHARKAEEAFVAKGYGVARYDLMYNDFILVGPSADPAGITGTNDIVAALRKISDGGFLFASRGDDSGTHKKELSLWHDASVNIEEHWYRSTGSGMGATLNTAVGLGAYVLTDRATWISFGNKSDFTIVTEGDDRLFNQYGVIQVNDKKCPNVNKNDAQTLIGWLLSDAGQRAIAAYHLGGQQLFFPNATSSENTAATNPDQQQLSQ